MAAAVVTQVGAMVGSAVADAPVSAAAAPILVELVVATAELGLAVLLAAMARGITRPESQQDATAATADMGKITTHRESRPEGRFMVPGRSRTVGSLPTSLPGRQVTRAAITSREIDPGLVLRANPAFSNATA
jgi:hypothetical protein